MPRIVEILIAGLALIGLIPLFACVALAIRVGGPGQILFLQKRIGLAGRPFVMVKFRTLDANGHPTQVGRFLRRYSLDETPEFLNVLRGDMALVGPRPMIAEEQPNDRVVRQKRQSLRPGITGWAQINGRNALSFDETYRLDLWYGGHRGVWLDLYILVATLPCVLTGHGACALNARRRYARSTSERQIQLVP